MLHVGIVFTSFFSQASLPLQWAVRFVWPGLYFACHYTITSSFPGFRCSFPFPYHISFFPYPVPFAFSFHFTLVSSLFSPHLLPSVSPREPPYIPWVSLTSSPGQCLVRFYSVLTRYVALPPLSVVIEAPRQRAPDGVVRSERICASARAGAELVTSIRTTGAHSVSQRGL